MVWPSYPTLHIILQLQPMLSFPLYLPLLQLLMIYILSLQPSSAHLGRDTSADWSCLHGFPDILYMQLFDEMAPQSDIEEQIRVCHFLVICQIYNLMARVFRSVEAILAEFPFYRKVTVCSFWKTLIKFILFNQMWSQSVFQRFWSTQLKTKLILIRY